MTRKKPSIVGSSPSDLHPHRPDHALASSEARTHALLEAAVDAILSIDARGIVQSINPSGERLFGYCSQEVIGQNIKMLMPAPYHEEHDGYVRRYLVTGQKRIIGIGREVVGLKKDGTTFPMDLSVADARLGDNRFFVGIIRDVSERKQNQEALSQLASIVESSHDAIVGKTLDGIIVTWNLGAERMFGYSLDEAKGRHISFIAPPDRPCEVQHMLERVKRGECVDHFETVRVRKDGMRIDVSVTISPIKDRNGKVLGASAIKRDITEQKRVNEEIRAMTQQLWQAAKLASVGELAASIAHELNNPLATVTLRVESILAKMSANDPHRRALDIVDQETKRMADLVANLLQFCRRGTGQVSSVDICQEVIKAIELIQHQLRKNEISVVKKLDPKTPTIFADRQKLRQVFLNVLTNASDATPPGGTLTLRAAPTTMENGKPGVLLEFSDTGAGIPAQHLERVMDPFFSTKEEGKGTGLGLAICRRIIVQEHHGLFQIASEVGQGTTVRIILPIRNGTDATAVLQE